MIRNIVFDMGNVLIRFDKDAFMDTYNVPAEDRPLLMREVYHSLEWSQMDRGSLTDLQAAEKICRRVPERLHDTVNKLVAMWDRPIIPVDGVEDIVRELKSMGYSLYLLSNASIRQHDYWPRVPGSELFDGTLISADEKLVKPQPEIYRRLFQKFSLIPEECVFIDDSTLNAEGAVWCGMQAIVFHDNAKKLRFDLRSIGVPVKE